MSHPAFLYISVENVISSALQEELYKHSVTYPEAPNSALAIHGARIW